MANRYFGRKAIILKTKKYKPKLNSFMKMHKCEICGKELNSEESLKNHKNDKHGIIKKSNFVKKSHLIYFSLVILILVAGFFTFKSATAPGEHDNFAKCLTEHGAIFYGAFWCSHCADQKKLFGKSIQYVNYIECSTPDKGGQTPICIGAKIRGYPTWEFKDGSRLSGLISLEDLSEKSECPLENLSEPLNLE